MKGLIVYYSFMGANEKLANELKNRSGFEVLEIRELKKRRAFSIFIDLLFNRQSNIQSIDIDLKQYDLVILVSPIWARKISSPMKAFVTREKDNISKYAFISLCDGNEKQMRKIFDELTERVGREPVAVEQLCISDLPKDIKKRINDSIPFRVLESDVAYFDDKINAFLERLN
ncbi:MAG TPA: hypothetical protein GX745_01045 [Clostridiales bacterium]|nr:hypothetical protein [Clostridiales bacterium]